MLDYRGYCREILDSLPGALALVFDCDLRVSFAEGDGFSRAAIDSEVLIGQVLPDVLPAPEWATLRGPFEGALEGRSCTFEFETGRVLYSTYVSPLVTAGTIVGALVVSHEMTELEQLEALTGSPEAIAREARRLDARNLAGVGTWEVDLETGAAYWSEEYHALYGVDPHRFAPSRAAFQEIVHPRDRRVVQESLDRIASDGTAMEIRYRILRPSDGEERYIRSHVHADVDRDGTPVRLLGTGQDVTDLVFVLTPREQEMLMLLAEGLSGEHIAERLFLSPATVRTHINNAMGKLGARTRGQAIARALRSEEIGS